MSYQTITDINLSSQKDLNYQVSNLLKDSGLKSSSTFEDLVSFYKNENKLNETKNSPEKKEENVKTDSKDVKNDKEPVKDEKSQEVKKEEKSEETEKSNENVKDESKKEVSNDKPVITSKEKLSENLENNISEEKTVNVQEEKVQNFTKEEKKSKLSQKDFSRISHIGENVGIVEEKVQLGENINKKSSKNVKSKDEKIDFENMEDKNSHDTNVLQNNIQLQGENINSSFNKASENKDDLMPFSKSEKKTFLDKDQKIEIQDMRSMEGKISDAIIENDNKHELKVSEPKLVNENTAQITMELNQNANANVLSNNTQTAAATGSNFQAMLNNQIQQSAPEFVKAGNLILKDNNQGTINLVLRPDDLGNVKLHLSLDGKNISGHITVATKEALEVFKDNAETLREAFIKNGFENASFDVSYGGQGGFNQEMAFEQQNDGTEFIARKVYGQGGTESETGSDFNEEKNQLNSDYSINIVA